MGKLRIVAALVAGFGLLGSAAPAACTGPAGTTAAGVVDVSVAVPMTCTGLATSTATITVSATLPDRVRAGRVYTVTNLTTDVPDDGAVTLLTTDGQPATLAAGSGGSSTVQLVAGTQQGASIALLVTRADYLLPGTIAGQQVTPGSEVHCLPAAPVALGSVKVVGPGSGPGTGTTAIDATLGLESQTFLGPNASTPARITLTVPAELHPGDTFSVPDLQVATPGMPSPAEPQIVVDGADPQAVTASTVHVVTARPGGTVELRLASVSFMDGLIFGAPLGSGHLASIPVVAR